MQGFSPEQGERQAPVVSFERYQSLNAELNSHMFRKVGIVDEAQYKQVIADDRTVYVGLQGNRVPALLSVEHATGYNIEKCREMCGTDNVYLLSLPAAALAENGSLKSTLDKLPAKEAAIIVEFLDEQTSELQEIVDQTIGDEWEMADFEDERLEGDNRRAAMSLYCVNGESRVVDSRGPLSENLYMDDLKESPNASFDTKFYTAQSLIAENLTDKLWGLYASKFSLLGDYHPVSMEEDAAHFKSLLLDQHTQSIVKFSRDENGEEVPVCLGFFIDDVESLYWLSDQFRSNMKEHSKTNGSNFAFFYGIVSASRPEESLHHSEEIIKLYTRLLNRRGGKTAIWFESTNLSSLYIPRLITKYTENDPEAIALSEPTRVVRQIYSYLRRKV